MERLRESYVFDNSHYTQLNEQEISCLHIKNHLQESINYTTEDLVTAGNSLKETLIQEKDKQLLDQIINRLKERGNKRNYSVWKLPVGRYNNENGNRRIYPKKLWENIRDKQSNVWKNFTGLADHPVKDNDPGEFKNQAVIWHDIDIGDNGVVYGYCSFVGPYGHLAQEILEHDGRVGTSSSGFGDVDKYSHQVDPETYVIERLADLVLNPSQGTFGDGDSPHTASEFMADVHNAATIEFNKQKVRESLSEITRSKRMAENTFDAANPQQQQQGASAIASPQSAAPQGAPAGQQAASQQSGGQPQQGAVPAQQGAQQKVQEKKMSGTLTKVEEKAFRKYVQTFLDDANKIDNPMKRLNECVEILECFEEGNCPDLQQQIQEQLLKEKGELEKLVEHVVQTEQDYDMPLTQFRESAERNTAQGLLLKEQVTDYEELCNGLAARNRKLSEENEKLIKMVKIKDRLAEKKIMQSNKEIVTTASEAESLQEQVMQLTDKNERLLERLSKMSIANKEFEKENGLLTTKLKEAGTIMKSFKEREKLDEQTKAKIKQDFTKLSETIKDLEAANQALTESYDTQSHRYDKLQESFDTYKKEVADTFNPTAHLVPKFEERVGKYLNLRENKGIEVEAYWSDLVNNYGDNIKPFEEKIRGAKTLKEATNNFLRYRTQIDPDFAVSQPAEFAYRNRQERAHLYETQGIPNPIESYQNATAEQKNAEFLNKLKESGLQ
jgi:hypothetical protein